MQTLGSRTGAKLTGWHADLALEGGNEILAVVIAELEGDLLE